MITRVCIIFWVVPLTLYTLWFILSANDINFGSIYLSRQMHDIVMQTYANLLGIDPAIIPALLIRAVVWDLAVVLAILAYRRRREIKAWWQARKAHASEPVSEMTPAAVNVDPLAVGQGNQAVERTL
ncbi:DUF6105 family protein [Notoacmeibacter ruber]|uniref:Uncharacterized protein n=1 Tax=Notoacmeibacter ruber TaxID=2670375 RepID=A0A3L7JGW8_9HYPH|nr:DUF6105 family protein [Notoacmeibacter ruber]RLQ87722.1 hypothetical protein D8780_05380 [Notoacmeibacter ruber]